MDTNFERKADDLATQAEKKLRGTLTTNIEDHS
jgi:hypothetical protein